MGLKEQYIRFMSHFLWGKNKKEYEIKWDNIKRQTKTSIKKDFGENNKLILFDDYDNDTHFKYIKNLDIIFYGNNNLLKFHYQLNISSPTLIICSGNNIIQIDKSAYPIDFHLPYRISPYSQLIIGKNFSSGYTEFRLHQESSQKIVIGDECMFSNNIYIKPSDGHTIYEDDENKKVVNKPKDIKIGDHVWIGRNVTVLKGSIIPKNSVVATGAIYTSSNNNILPDGGGIFAGIPAKVIRNNINWNRMNVEEFEKNYKKIG